MLLNGFSKLPEAVQQVLSVMRFNVQVFFIRQKVNHRSTLLCRDTAAYQLVQNGNHLVPPHGTAFQQNFADCQYFAVAQIGGIPLDQTVNLLPCVIDDLPRRSLVCKKTAQVFNIPLKTALVDAKAVSGSLLLYPGSFDEVLIQVQQPRTFLNFHISRSSCLPSYAFT